MDVFPTLKSECLMAIAHPGKWDPFESLMQQGRVQAFISYMDLPTMRIFHHHIQDWTTHPLYVDNFKRSISGSKKVKFFDPRQVKWARVCKKLKSNPVSTKKTSDQRMNFKMDNILLVKQYFSFGFWTVPANEGHVFQTSDAPMLIYELQENSMACKPSGSLVEQDQCYYKRYVLRPNSVYVVPPLTNYLFLTVQKTLFAIDIMAWEDVQGLQDFRSHNDYTLDVYNLPPPTPSHQFEEGPKMVTPQDRLARKNKNGTVPQQQEEQHTFVAPDQIFFFEEPMDSSTQNWTEILENDVPQEAIDRLFQDFELNYCGSPVGPAHQIQMDRPSPHQPPRVLSILPPPPPDNYWTPADPEPPVITSFPMDVQEAPLDLTTNCSVVGPRKQHVFSVKLPLDLRVQKI
ncbi:hypothetical protein AVEN_91090-1 [Araneus ventricosus]|uniref:Uncharacterized protein n=1 Tax=Araneus ventricosus TaxID=182803 RepID=A0A4Y1ZUA1_ARAVE|nr:hypothetical protein AVEN_91090-1 [Araneus ventricosus]